MTNTDFPVNSFNTLIPIHDELVVLLSVIIYRNDFGIVLIGGQFT
jgi:hypothetical protein